MITSMKPLLERLLIGENDPELIDLLTRQTLQGMGYRIEVVQGAPGALQEAARFFPDIIIANLHLPGLSG
jgi:CheY-like chemotaxis protein